MLEILLVILIIVFIVKKVNNNSETRHNKNKQPQYYDSPYETEPQIDVNVEKGKDYKNGYQPKWLLTYNEKSAYKTIKQVTDEKGYTVFTKVRLLDLVEPRDSNRKDQSYLWKIQAKHVSCIG